MNNVYMSQRARDSLSNKYKSKIKQFKPFVKEYLDTGNADEAHLRWKYFLKWRNRWYKRLPRKLKKLLKMRGD